MLRRPVVQNVLGKWANPFSGTALKLSVCEQSAQVGKWLIICPPI